MATTSFVNTLSAAFAAMLLPAAAFGGAERAWFESALVGIETGPTGAQFGHSDTNDTRYCARFNGREIVRQGVAAHSEYLGLWVRHGDYAYYDSKLLPKAPGLGSRDPLREALELGHNPFTAEALALIVRSGEGLLRRTRNLCLSSLIEAVRDQTRSVDLKHVNRVLLQPHWRKDCDQPLA